MHVVILSRYGWMVLSFVLLVLHGVHANAAAFDIGLDGRTAYPASANERLGNLLRSSEGRQLTHDELEEFKAVLVKQGWPTYRTSGPQAIEVCGELLRRSGVDFEFQKYMFALLDQQVGDDIRPIAYARLADQAYAAHERVQLYGTLLRRDEGTLVVDPPIKSEGTMLFFRDFYGLPSLEEELRDSGDDTGRTSAMDDDGALSKQPPVYTRPDIRKLLGELIYEDQSLRGELHQALSKGDKAEIERIKTKIIESDKKSTAGIKQIFDKVGFPTREMVGIDGVSTAFLLVQHADADPEFQKKALALAEPLMKTRGMSRRQYAMLADRVALATGQPQIYGTQMELRDGTYVLQPTADLENLDQRRSEMALGPYQKMLDSANSDD